MSPPQPPFRIWGQISMIELCSNFAQLCRKIFNCAESYPRYGGWSWGDARSHEKGASIIENDIGTIEHN